jgi:Cu2+-containing amine oxidase
MERAKLKGAEAVQVLFMSVQIRSILGLAFSALAASTLTAETRISGRVHPLDPLSKSEISAVVAVLKRADKITPEMRFAQIYLKEPPKSQVMEEARGVRASHCCTTGRLESRAKRLWTPSGAP